LKIDGGLPLAVMKEIAVLNNESISFEKIKRFELFSRGEGCSALMSFVIANMILSQDIKELIVVGRG
jgi:hypothetical protein